MEKRQRGQVDAGEEVFMHMNVTDNFGSYTKQRLLPIPLLMRFMSGISNSSRYQTVQ